MTSSRVEDRKPSARLRDQGINVADVEVWFGDEARIGQKNKITRRSICL